MMMNMTRMVMIVSFPQPVPALINPKCVAPIFASRNETPRYSILVFQDSQQDLHIGRYKDMINKKT